MKTFAQIFTLCLYILLPHSVFAETTKKLTPPLLTATSTQSRIACTRPMREGKFNISVEDKDNQVLVHCYGHGGSGCTTSFGSVAKAIQLYEDHVGTNNKMPIRVIGGGIIGLTAAIELAHKGYPVVGIVAKELYDMPSWKNAGYFALVSVKTSEEEQESLRCIGMNTFLEYKKIHDGQHAYIGADCIRMLPVYCGEGTESGVELLEEAGLIPARELVTLDFGNGVTHENFVQFMTYFMDTTQIMIQLHAEVKRLGIPIEVREISNFNEIPESVVFNCTGLGAKVLNNDDQMIPVRGHLINLSQEAGTQHMDYMIYTKVKGDNDTYEYIYMFPKCLQVTADKKDGDVVYGTLGGTFIPIVNPMSEAEFEELDRVEFQKLVERSNKFFFGVPTL